MNTKLSIQKNLIFTLSLTASCLLGDVLVSGVVAPQSGYAAASAEQRKTRRTPAMRERTYKKLSNAQEDFDNNNAERALQTLNELKKDETLNEYELGMVLNYIAYYYAGKGDYQKALNVFKQIDKLPKEKISEVLEQQTLFNMAQMYLALDRPKDTIRALNDYHKIAQPTTQTYYYISQACYLIGDFKCSVREGENAVRLAKSQGGQPQENWLLVLKAGYHELNDTAKIVSTLETLVKLYPKGDYFLQLASMYGNMKKEDRQLNVLEASYDGGYFSKSGEYLSLVSLLLNAEVPYKAAKVMVEGIEKEIVKESVTNLKMLAQAWLVAREPHKSIRVLKTAAKKSDTGELFVRLGQAYMNLDDWTGCISSVRAGFKKGDIKRNDSAHITLGVCLFNVDKLDQAIEQFKAAAKYKRSQEYAQGWIDYLRNEKTRRRSIAESLT